MRGGGWGKGTTPSYILLPYLRVPLCGAVNCIHDSTGDEKFSKLAMANGYVPDILCLKGIQ